MTDKPKYDRGYEAHVDEFARVIARAPETPSTRVVRRPAPTLEDVDAELQPKGLPALQWDAQGPAWVGNWLPAPKREDAFVRALVTAPEHGKAAPDMHIATVFKMAAGRWTCINPISSSAVTFSDDHPTPEAAQAACEAAIIAAWRNR